MRSMKPKIDLASASTMESFDHIGYSTIEYGLTHGMHSFEKQLEPHVRNHTGLNVAGECQVVFDDTGVDCNATSVCWLPTIRLDGLTAAIEHFEE